METDFATLFSIKSPLSRDCMHAVCKRFVRSLYFKSVCQVYVSIPHDFLALWGLNSPKKWRDRRLSWRPRSACCTSPPRSRCSTQRPMTRLRRRTKKRAARAPARSFDMRLVSLNARSNARELQSECSACLKRARTPCLRLETSHIGTYIPIAGGLRRRMRCDSALTEWDRWPGAARAGSRSSGRGHGCGHARCPPLRSCSKRRMRCFSGRGCRWRCLGGARSAVHQAACSRHRPETGAFAARRALLGCSGRGPHGAAPAPRFQSRSRLNYLAEAGALYALAAAIAGKPLLPP